MNKITFQFYFYIFSYDKYDSDTVTKFIGIEPTKQWSKDEANPKPLYNKMSGWQLSSEEIPSLIFEDAFVSFYKKIKFSIAEIEKLIIRDNLSCNIDVVVRLYSGNCMPGINLKTDLMIELSSIKCNMDFDIYDNRDAKVKMDTK